jgi:hypothetical protein
VQSQTSRTGSTPSECRHAADSGLWRWREEAGRADRREDLAPARGTERGAAQGRADKKERTKKQATAVAYPVTGPATSRHAKRVTQPATAGGSPGVTQPVTDPVTPGVTSDVTGPVTQHVPRAPGNQELLTAPRVAVPIFVAQLRDARTPPEAAPQPPVRVPRGAAIAPGCSSAPMTRARQARELVAELPASSQAIKSAYLQALPVAATMPGASMNAWLQKPMEALVGTDYVGVWSTALAAAFALVALETATGIKLMEIVHTRPSMSAHVERLWWDGKRSWLDWWRTW